MEGGAGERESLRKQHDFSKGVRGNPYPARLRRSRANCADTDQLPLLTRSQIREIERRVRDSEDRTRYLLATIVAPRFILYYNVSEDSYGMNDPDHATLFKRRAAAAAIQGVVGGKTKIVRCRVNKRDKLVLRSLPSPFPERRPRRRGAATP